MSSYTKKSKKWKTNCVSHWWGVAIVYTEENFYVEDAGIETPEGVEAGWVILTPKLSEINTVKKILVGGIYISPSHNANKIP